MIVGRHHAQALHTRKKPSIKNRDVSQQTFYLLVLLREVFNHCPCDGTTEKGAKCSSFLVINYYHVLLYTNYPSCVAVPLPSSSMRRSDLLLPSESILAVSESSTIKVLSPEKDFN